MNWVRRPRSHPEHAFLCAVPGSSGRQAEQKWNSANSLRSMSAFEKRPSKLLQ